MIYDGNDFFTFSAQTGATLVPDATRRTASYNPIVNQNTGVIATQTIASDALTLGGGGIGYVNQLVAVIKYSAAANASGANTLQFVLQDSLDNATWTDRFVGDVINLTTVAKTGTTTIQFATQQKYLRLRPVISGTGTGSTVTVTQAGLTMTDK